MPIFVSTAQVELAEFFEGHSSNRLSLVVESTEDSQAIKEYVTPDFNPHEELFIQLDDVLIPVAPNEVVDLSVLRPDRFEPRQGKWRPKPYPYL